ncbi:unnamed protein product, partial [marine sediment metagenome]
RPEFALLPCCMSDIIYPLLFIKKGENKNAVGR